MFGRSSGRITLACPACGHEQQEPALAISTVCRGCGINYRIEKGKPIAPPRSSFQIATRPSEAAVPGNEPATIGPGIRTRSPESLLENPPAEPARPDPATEPSDAAPVIQPEDNDSPSEENPATPELPPAAPAPAADPFAPSRYVPPTRDVAPQSISPAIALGKLFRRAPEERIIRCYECGREHTTIPGAESAQCPGCGTYISLRDYEIADRTNRLIQTRGDVTVLKTGAFTGSLLQCHHLTVMGDFSSAVDCSGNFILRHSCKINGGVKCGHLVIERGVRVEFQGAVEAKTVTIEGEAKGNIRCFGKVTLEKKAKLEGDVTTAALVVRPGAKHSGAISIVSKPDA